jgi:hypothetical protein
MATHGIDLYSTNYKVEEHEVWSCRSESDCQAQYETLYDLVSHMRNVHPACTITCQVNGCEQEFSTASVWYWHVRRNHITLYTTRKRRSNTFAVKTMECPEEDDDQSQFGLCLQIPHNSATIGESILDKTMETVVIADKDENATTEEQDSDSKAEETLNECAVCDEKVVKDRAMSWLIKLREVHHLSDKALADVIEMSKALHLHFATSVESVLETVQKDSTCQTSCMQKLRNHLAFDFTGALDSLKSSYQRRLHIAGNYHFVEPVWHEIGTHVSSSKGKLENISNGFYYVPLLDSLQALLNHPQVYNQVVFGPHLSENTKMYDVCDGSLFKSHPIFSSKPNALQVIVYYDEFTAVNPISPTSQKYKLGMFSIIQ